jgi:hypothetical protein
MAHLVPSLANLHRDDTSCHLDQQPPSKAPPHGQLTAATAKLSHISSSVSSGPFCQNEEFSTKD